MHKLIERLAAAKQEGRHEWIQCEADERSVLAGRRARLRFTQSDSYLGSAETASELQAGF